MEVWAFTELPGFNNVDDGMLISLAVTCDKERSTRRLTLTASNIFKESLYESAYILYVASIGNIINDVT